MPEVQRILIATKYRFIGDTLLSVPAIRATAELWPNAKISLLTGSKALEIVQNCPHVHDAVEFDPYRSCDQGVKRFFDVVSDLRKRRFDIALVLNRSFHSALISTLGGAKLRAGWSGFSNRDFLLDATCPYSPDDSEIDSYLDVVACAYKAFEARPLPPAFNRNLQVWLTADERAAVDDELRGPGVYIGIQPGATHAYKRWPAKYFAALADHIVQSYAGAKIVLVGGSDECAIAGDMLDLCSQSTRNRTINLTGKLPLRGTLVALESLTCFVANDTAIRHAAVSLGIPSIGLFGPTSALKWGNADPPTHQVVVAPSGQIEELTVDAISNVVDSVIRPRLAAAHAIEVRTTGNVVRQDVAEHRNTPRFRNILLTTKHRYLGDTLLAGPALKAIRRHWPDAQVTLLTGSNAAELMRGCPYVDSIIPFNPDSPEFRGMNLYLRLVRELKDRKIDAALVYHTSVHAALTPWLAGIRYRVGWAGFERGFERRDLLFTDTLPYDTERSEVECNLDMVRHIAPGLMADPDVELWLSDDERENIPESLRVSEPIVGLQPGATNDGKRWPPAYYADLARMLLDQGYAGWIAMIGGADEERAAEEMLAECLPRVRERVINLVGRTKLRQTLAVLARLAFFVGNDTAIRHTTVALDVPSLGLFGPTNHKKWGNHKPPRQQIIVSPTHQMKDISPTCVFEAVVNLAK